MLGIDIRKALELKPEDSNTVTTTDMFNSVWQIVRAMPELKEAVDCLDYAIPASDVVQVKQVAEDSRLLVYVNAGGSEGVYVDAKLCSKERGWIDIGTLKTLEEGPAAYRKMGQLCGVLTWAFERCLSNFY